MDYSKDRMLLFDLRDDLPTLCNAARGLFAVASRLKIIKCKFYIIYVYLFTFPKTKTALDNIMLKTVWLLGFINLLENLMVIKNNHNLSCNYWK